MHNKRVWFKNWISEGYSLRQISKQSGLSYKEVKSIKSYWLSQKPPSTESLEEVFDKAKHLIFDATYFAHERCIMVMRDSETAKVIASKHALRENYINTIDWFHELRNHGLEPHSVTMDGQLNVIGAVLEVWPECIIQRCIYHIQRQGESWLRRYPKTSLAKDLKYILHSLTSIDTLPDKDIWISRFRQWKEKYAKEIKLLSNKDKVEADIIRAYRVIENASPNMFHYLLKSNIPKTSNALEGYFSHLKRLYRSHAGLRKTNLNHYLSWYIYFKNL